jgi:hypothetical protein
MRFTWDERKRRANLRDHGFDFADAKHVFEGFTASHEDNRFLYGEQRFVTLGLLTELPFLLCTWNPPDRIHVISFRRATKYEEIFLIENL